MLLTSLKALARIRRDRRVTATRQRKTHLRRGLTCETLEDRRMLAVDTFAATEATITLAIGDPLGGQMETIDLTGITQVFRSDEPTDVIPTGGNGLEEVILRVEDMDLSGDHPDLGPVALQLNRQMTSQGFAEETGNAVDGQLDAPITSTLEMFVQVAVPLQGIMEAVNFQPIRMDSILSQVPPGVDEAYAFDGIVQLFDATTGQPFQPPIFITHAEHTVNPQGPVEADCEIISKEPVLTVTNELPAAGTDFFDSTATLTLTIGGDNETISFEGPTTVSRSDPDAANNNVVQTEMISMQLSGQSYLLGQTLGLVDENGDPAPAPILIFENPDAPSPGQIIPLDPAGNEDFPALSFFDVDHLIQTPLGVIPGQVHMETEIFQIPPLNANYIGAINTVIVDPDTGQEIGSISGQINHQVIKPAIPVNTEVVFEVETVVTNNGPYGPADFVLTASAVAPDGCTITPHVANISIEGLAVGEQRTVIERFTVYGWETSQHHFQIDNVIAPLEPHVIDPNDANNAMGTELRVAIVGEADGAILSKEPRLTVTNELPDAGTDFFDSIANLTLTIGAQSEVITLEGPTTVNRSDPDAVTRAVQTEIVSMQLSGQSTLLGEVLGLEDEAGNPTTAPILIFENPDAPSLGMIQPLNVDADASDFPAYSFFDVDHFIQTPLGVIPGQVRLEAERITAIPPLHTDYIGVINTPIIDPQTGDVIGWIAGQINHRPIKPAIKVNEEAEFVVETVVTNNGPFGPADFYLTSTAVAPPGCTISPSAEKVLIKDLAVGEKRTVLEHFTIYCWETSQHHFKITNKITPVDVHVHDTDLTNDLMRTELRVAVVGDTDGEILSKQPRLTVSNALPDAGVDFFDSVATLTIEIGDQSETITLEGPTTVNRSDPAADTHVVQTEIVSMQLSGQSALLGQTLGLEDENGNPAPAPILIFEDEDLASLGEIQPLNAAVQDFPALSYFDVAHWIQTPLGVIPGQVRLQANEITQIPPLNTDYIGTINTPIEDPATGAVIGYIRGQINHRPIKPAIPVNTEVEFVVETVVTNNGPFGPADFYLTSTAVAPPGCTITPRGEKMLIEDLAVNEQRTVLEYFTIFCWETSQHHFQITNKITPVDVHVRDTDLWNDLMTTELRVAVVGDADGEVVSKEAKLTVSDALPAAGTDVFDSVATLTLEIGDDSETITLEGPTTVNRSDPDTASRAVQTEIVSMQLSGESALLGQALGLVDDEGNPATAPILIFENPDAPSLGQITPLGANGDGDFPAFSFFDIDHLIQTPLGVIPGQVRVEANITQIPPLHTDYIGDIDTVIIDPDTGVEIGRISGQINHRPIKPAIPVNEEVEFVVETVVTNNGPFGPADFYLTSTAMAPAGCTVKPRGEVMLIEDLAVGEQRTVFEKFTIYCWETSQHHFQITNKITPCDVHVRDTDIWNDLLTTELRVAVVGDADGGIVSKEARLTVSDNLPGAGTDFFDSTARLTLTIGTQSEVITLEGPTTVDRSDPDTATRAVQTEIVSMQLSGESVLLGQVLGLEDELGNPTSAPILIFENPDAPSPGMIQPLDQNADGSDFPAYSFFDVDHLIQTPLGVIPGRVRLEAEQITQIPPLNTDYIGVINTPIIDPDTGNVIGWINGQINHRPIKPAIKVNEEVEFVVETVVTNNGPFGPADFYLTSTAVAPPGCTITPRGEKMLIEDLAVGERRTVLEHFTIFCWETSQHHFQITNKITPVDVHVRDTDISNDLMRTELRVAVVGDADGEILSKRPRLAVSNDLPDAGTDFFDSTARLTLEIGNQTETIHLEGPTTVDRSDPDAVTNVVQTEIVAMQLSGRSALLGQMLGLVDEDGNPAPAPIVIFENPDAPSLGQIQPLDPTGQGADFPALSFFDVDHFIQTPLGLIPGQVRLEAEINQIPPLNTNYIGAIDTVITHPETGEVIGRIRGQINHRPIKPAIPVNKEVEFVVETVVTNNGPFGPADFYLTSTAVAPPGCTITPRGEKMLIEDLAVGEYRTVLEYFTIYCEETSQHHFQITNKITPVDVHVRDTDLFNDLMTTELRVAVVGEADGKVVSFEAVDPPTEVRAGEPVEITLKKVLHNRGPFGPAEFDVVKLGLAPAGCTVTPSGQIETVTLPVCEPVELLEKFVIQCDEPGTHTFRFVNKIDPHDVHLVDPDFSNNRAIFDLTVEVVGNFVEEDVFEETTALIQLVGGPFGISPTPLILRGPAEAHVFFEGPLEGDAQDDDGNSLDEVGTQLMSLNLTDGSAILRLNSARPSLGEIEELANNTPGLLDLDPFATGSAHSFFDVFFEIVLPDGTVFYNDRPLYIHSVIDEKPPLARYTHVLPHGPLELVDAAGNPTGVFITAAEHYTGYTEVDFFANSLGEVEIIAPDGSAELVPLSGPTRVAVYFEDGEGEAQHDDRNGREEVETEMIQLNLTGVTAAGVPVAVRLHPTNPSRGLIEETVDNTPGVLDIRPFTEDGTADSFFDVFFEIQVGEQLFYPATSKRLSSVIDYKPPGPGTVYEDVETIPLLDAWGRPTGYSIGATRHIPNTDEPGRITVIKDALPDDPQVFDFTGDLGNFQLDDDGGGTALPEMRTFVVPPGSYDVTETLVADWELTNIAVVDPDGGSTVDLAGATASLDLDSGEHITVMFTNFKVQFDYGDAPETPLGGYHTTLAANGARHTKIRGGPWLGDDNDAPDVEPNGQPINMMPGDDDDGNDDEDGVIVAPLAVGHTGVAYVYMNDGAGGAGAGGGFLDAWIDFNGDMLWSASEKIHTGWLPHGWNALTFMVTGSGFASGETFGRFRASSVGGLLPTGEADDGEVEDHRIVFERIPDNVKWLQWPDLTPNGVDIRVDSLRVAADDFLCTDRSLLTDAHLWGSWKDDVVGQIESIHLSIHKDDPVGTDGFDQENEFSKPDPDVLWAMDFGADQFSIQEFFTLPGTGEFWWDPNGELTPDGDNTVWQIDIQIDPKDAFLQTGSEDRPVIYWLDVRVNVADAAPGTAQPEFGWKTRMWPDHFMDDAVWDYGSELPRLWKELRYPDGHPYHGLEKDSIDLAFALTFEEVTNGSIHGFKYEDLNADGRDNDEPRIAGVEIQLRDKDVLPSYVENWDSSPGPWQYWVEDPLSAVRGGRNQPVDWSSTGGYADTGYISTPLDELFVTFDAFWPAYMAPPDPVDAVDLTDKTVRVRVTDFGTSGLPDDSLRLFVGEWNEDDEYIFYAHNTPIPVGDDWSTLTWFDIGDDSNWSVIEDGGLAKMPSDLYVNPQQWGFALTGVAGPGVMPVMYGTLAFDELRIVDEVIATTVTDENGEYAFETLAPGRTYVVTETTPDGMSQTSPDPQPIQLESGYEWVASQEQADKLIAQGMDPNKIVIYPPLAFGNRKPDEIEVDLFPETVLQLLVELPPEPGIVTRRPDLPPTDGVYMSPSDVHATYSGADLQIVLQDIRHKPFADPPPIIVNAGPDEIETFESGLLTNAVITSDALGLDGELVQMELAGPVQTVVLGKANSALGSYIGEIVEMTLIGDISNGPQVTIREDPTQQSVGQTTITDLGGGLYHIDSFFDVFTELSVDGGNTWIAADAPVRVQLVQPGIVTENPELPPTDGVYRSAEQVHAEFRGPELEIVLQDIRHQPFADRIQRVEMGADEVETFQSGLTGVAIVTAPAMGLFGTPLAVELTGPVETIVSDKVDNTTGDFLAEIVSMELSGDLVTPGGEIIQMVIQESPTLASVGRTTINDRGNGEFPVESFFDVFTELSVDGGQSWIAASDKVRVELAPRPKLLPLVGPAEVWVFFEGGMGAAQDDDTVPDGRDEVLTEIKSMDLKGYTPQGPIHAGVRADRASLGEIEEQSQVTPGRLDVDPFTANTSADSFFDVWPEITVGGAQLVTDRPIRIETVIDHKPPQDGERYVNPFLERVELIDPVTGAGTGIFVIREVHQPDTTVEHDLMPHGRAVVTLDIPGVGPVKVNMHGSTAVDVFFEGPAEGDAVDDDFNGLDEVAAQMKSLELAGKHPDLGEVFLRLNANEHTLGRIEENSDLDTGRLDLQPLVEAVATTADSFFDVFFEIEIPSQQLLLHNERPARMAGTITHKPPGRGDVYVKIQGPVELYNEYGQLTGVVLTDALHEPNHGTDLVGVHRNRNFFMDINGNGIWDRIAGGDMVYAFGSVGDIPIIGDWNGDGYDEIGVYKEINSRFYLDFNGNGKFDGAANGDKAPIFGTPYSGMPIIGDWNGDGIDDVGLHVGHEFQLDYDGDGKWRGPAGGDLLYAFGADIDTAIIGDWNGDGTDDIGSYRAASYKFFLDANGNGRFDGTGPGLDKVHIYKTGETPISGDWLGDGQDQIGSYATRLFYLDKNDNGNWDKLAGGDMVHAFGAPEDTPLTGKWAPRPPVLLATSGQAAKPAVPADGLTLDEAAPIVEKAIETWSAAPLSAAQMQTLGQVDVQIVNLPGPMLGQAQGTSIAFDFNAARHGWFVDPTPGFDEEFDTAVASGLLASDGSPASGRMDLFTAALHELGHLLGFEDDLSDPLSDRIMSGWLDAGIRKGLSQAEIDRLFADQDNVGDLMF